GEAPLPVLHGGHRALERGAGGVGGAAVLVAAPQASDTVLLVGAAGVDGRVDRPGHLVGLVAGVDRTRVEAGLVAVFLGHEPDSTTNRSRSSCVMPGGQEGAKMAVSELSLNDASPLATSQTRLTV